MAQVFFYFWIAIWLLQAAWAVRLWRLGLAARYPVLVTYLVASTLLGVGASLLHQAVAADPRGSVRIIYGWYWVVSQPLHWTLLFCVLVELYNNILDGFRGFQQLGKLVMKGASAAVGLLFLGMILLEKPSSEWRQFWNFNQRNIYVALTLLSLLLLVAALYFGLQVARNVRILYTAFAISFASAAILRTINGLGWKSPDGNVGYLISVVYAGCMLYAALSVSLDGETIRRPAAPGWLLNRRAEAEISGGLQSFNDQLSRILRS